MPKNFNGSLSLATDLLDVSAASVEGNSTSLHGQIFVHHALAASTLQQRGGTKMEAFLVTCAKIAICYLIMGLLFWIALPTLQDASGKRPKLWKITLVWGPIVFLPISGPIIKEWMWRK